MLTDRRGSRHDTNQCRAQAAPAAPPMLHCASPGRAPPQGAAADARLKALPASPRHTAVARTLRGRAQPRRGAGGVGSGGRQRRGTGGRERVRTGGGWRVEGGATPRPDDALPRRLAAGRRAPPATSATPRSHGPGGAGARGAEDNWARRAARRRADSIPPPRPAPTAAPAPQPLPRRRRPSSPARPQARPRLPSIAPCPRPTPSEREPPPLGRDPVVAQGPAAGRQPTPGASRDVAGRQRGRDGPGPTRVARGLGGDGPARDPRRVQRRAPRRHEANFGSKE